MKTNLLSWLVCIVAFAAASQSHLDKALDAFQREKSVASFASSPGSMHRRSPSKMKRSSEFSRNVRMLRLILYVNFRKQLFKLISI